MTFLPGKLAKKVVRNPVFGIGFGCPARLIPGLVNRARGAQRARCILLALLKDHPTLSDYP
jgi:hypothetical protein